MGKLDLLVLGEANVDLIMRAEDPTPVYGQEKLVEDLTLTIGGSASIFACQAARLGLRTGLVSIVGEDTFGRYMLQSLSECGVDTTHIARVAQIKTGATLSLTTASDRAFLTYPGTIAALDSAEIDPVWLTQARHIHVASYFLQPRLQPGLPALLGAARAAGATVSLDTGWDPANRWDTGLPDTLSQVDLFLPNEIEALSITGLSSVDGALALLAERIPLVVIKLGAEGAIARREGETVRIKAIPMRVVDTTGAGDSFDAGFVYAYLQGLPLSECLEFGVLCGGLSTRAAGGTGAQPSLEEVLAARGAIGLP